MERNWVAGCDKWQVEMLESWKYFDIATREGTWEPERGLDLAIWKRISTTTVTRCLFLPLVIPSKLDPAESGDKFWEPVHRTFTFGAVFWKHAFMPTPACHVATPVLTLQIYFSTALKYLEPGIMKLFFLFAILSIFRVDMINSFYLPTYYLHIKGSEICCKAEQI